mmetsp:Transcript_9621/g.16671  ORF Transcript_9621/g.16671 Transcript_9621/m.16671 type:complete len:128 (-) Transcript_9621:21-404(-)
MPTSTGGKIKNMPSLMQFAALHHCLGSTIPPSGLAWHMFWAFKDNSGVSTFVKVFEIWIIWLGHVDVLWQRLLGRVNIDQDSTTSKSAFRSGVRSNVMKWAENLSWSSWQRHAAEDFKAFDIYLGEI